MAQPEPLLAEPGLFLWLVRSLKSNKQIYFDWSSGDTGPFS